MTIRKIMSIRMIMRILTPMDMIIMPMSTAITITTIMATRMITPIMRIMNITITTTRIRPPPSTSDRGRRAFTSPG